MNINPVKEIIDNIDKFVEKYIKNTNLSGLAYGLAVHHHSREGEILNYSYNMNDYVSDNDNYDVIWFHRLERMETDTSQTNVDTQVGGQFFTGLWRIHLTGLIKNDSVSIKNYESNQILLYAIFSKAIRSTNIGMEYSVSFQNTQIQAEDFQFRTQEGNLNNSYVRLTYEIPINADFCLENITSCL